MPKPTRHETFKSDTVRPKPEIKEVPVYIKAPLKTYTITITDTTACNLVRIYRDSLRDANQVIYYQDSIQGRLLGKKIDYKLFVPLTITNTHTITDSIPYSVNIRRNGVYLTGGIGGNINQFDFSIGAELVTKNRLGVGYQYGVTQKTHQVRAGYLLFGK